MGNISNSRILVIYPHGIGDVIMGTPAFRALRRNFKMHKSVLQYNQEHGIQGLYINYLILMIYTL